MTAHLLKDSQVGISASKGSVCTHLGGGDPPLDFDDPLAVRHRVGEDRSCRLGDDLGASKKFACLL